MRIKIHKIYHAIILFLFFYLLFFPALLSAEVTASYLYNLSNFSGTVPYNWARIFVDTERTEIYVLYQNLIKVFNSNGMEVYSFGDDTDLGLIVDITVDSSGNVIMLSYRGENPSIIYCNFRGETLSETEIKNLPLEFSDFSPNRLIYRNGKLYLVAYNSMKVAVIDPDGNIKDTYNIMSIISGEESEDMEKTKELNISGFSVDANGDILFTISVIFKAFRVTPDKKVTSFGKPGGSPGKFGIMAGIVSDSRGNYLVVDKLKSVVSVFDKDKKFLTEFGHRGLKPDNLIAPDDLAIDSNDRVYITQSRKRGVSVFRLVYTENNIPKKNNNEEVLQVN